VFQDAWAVIDHHVVYKNETVVSKKIQRELNCISATLETADNNLVTIKNTRRANLQRIDKLKNNTSKFLKSKLTIDTFSKYLDWKYEELYRELWSGQMAFVFNIIQDKLKIKTLQELDMIVDRNKNKFNKVAAKLKGTKSFKSSSVAVALSLAIEYPKGLSNKDIPNEWIDVLNKLD